ncbi:bifunctional (p)ppGpp synthetase/guanosine-3',5'-bis(diphosphate) 3'-pyrophosphohydrolase [Xanthobacter dioxanivorans]|uniref:Bifunctional (P)ppGpp synthetase/guanosine-3',5'-bis(Diphosphate) 3'-pyrophosphohydrolase n=1 Tax=Xanthobacter dioxanivorans TaxID=2528964 RepID=A0A974PN34_9HYPH|nr:HD domain-containing protein [Xanthobacter dioxanivorans]QRG06585.1 bifunctional (p)ppGpp synthetase/guanosine-3',5'-bis(diphosphate) 3'-pyrophosphohydrolase [Xanthobacter dioxanivorans]
MTHAFPPAPSGDAGAGPLALVVRALAFATLRHTDQRRKGRRAQPYVNHLAEVALLVSEATGGADGALVAAALLHDVVEDQAVTAAEIEATFGADVAGLVMEVTDDKALEPAERKRLQVAHAPHLTERAKLLKLADKTANLRSLSEDPPEDWGVTRMRAYVEWSRAVVQGLRGRSPALEAAFDAAAEEAMAAIDARVSAEAAG